MQAIAVLTLDRPIALPTTLGGMVGNCISTTDDLLGNDPPRKIVMWSSAAPEEDRSVAWQAKGNLRHRHLYGNTTGGQPLPTPRLPVLMTPPQVRPTNGV